MGKIIQFNMPCEAQKLKIIELEALSSKPSRICVSDTAGQIYSRTLSQTLGDIGAFSNLGGTINGDVTIKGKFSVDADENIVINTDADIVMGAEAIQLDTNCVYLPQSSYIAFGSRSENGLVGTQASALSISSSGNIHLGANQTNNSIGIHTGDTYINALNGGVYLKNASGTLLRWFKYSGSGYSNIFRCETNSAAALGSDSARWYKLYAASACSTSSDEREKSDIMYISDYPIPYSRNDNNGNTFEQFFDKLVPATYTLNVESTDDLHIGFIAQDVEKAASEVGLPIDDLGFIQHSYWKDEETNEEKDRYALCYEEFIALNTYMIQKLKTQVREQQSQIEELKNDITELKQLVNTLTQ